MNTEKKWNWQQDNWPHFEFEVADFQKYENEFLLNAWKLSWALVYLHKTEKDNLQVQLLSDEAMNTSEIEGEYLDRDSVQSSIQKKLWMKVAVNHKAAESGIAELMIDCFENFSDALTHERLYKWHHMICEGRNDLQDIWRYRTHSESMQVVSGQIDRPKIHFEAPESSQMKQEMIFFFTWIQNSQLSPLLKSWIAHMYFISIHPFEDGNGRIVRAICEHILSHSLNKPSFTILSRQIQIQRKEYYEILEKSNKNMNIRSWLDWYCNTVLQAQKYALMLIDFTIKKTKLLDSISGNINQRQEKVLIRMCEAWPEGFIGWLSAANYIKITKATVPTTTRDLSSLVSKWALKKTGERKSTRYWLNI